MVGVVDVAQRAPATASRMAKAAQRYLDSLDDARRKATQFAFEDQERFRWNYRPDGFFIDGSTFWHEGLRLINMTPEQQQAAMALIDSGSFRAGSRTSSAIRSCTPSRSSASPAAPPPGPGGPAATTSASTSP